MKKALITGVTGQDGSYLADLLIEKGYEVHGIRRRSSGNNLNNIKHLLPKEGEGFYLHYGDLTDSSSLNRIVEKINPDEVYNLAAQSHVHTSFQVPEYTAEVDAIGTLRLLDAIKSTKINTKFYQASTSELYGKVKDIPQNEDTPFNPRSPYAIAKLYSYWITKNYREAYNIFACNGILFNHESPRRGKEFVTRKITTAISRIYKGEQDKIYLGNLDAKRDWGYAKEYVEAMWKMMQQKHCNDYIVATGENHTIREFVEESFRFINIDLIWEDSGIEEKGIDKKSGKVLVEVDPYFYRPTEVDVLLGDYSKIKNNLGWEPKVKFKDLVEIMMKSDLNGE